MLWKLPPMNRLRSGEIIRLRTKAFVIFSILRNNIPDIISDLQVRQEQELLAEIKDYETDLTEFILLLYATSYKLEKNTYRLTITAEEAIEIETEMEYVRNGLKIGQAILLRCIGFNFAISLKR